MRGILTANHHFIKTNEDHIVTWRCCRAQEWIYHHHVSGTACMCVQRFQYIHVCIATRKVCKGRKYGRLQMTNYYWYVIFIKLSGLYSSPVATCLLIRLTGGQWQPISWSYEHKIKAAIWWMATPGSCDHWPVMMLMSLAREWLFPST